MSWSLIKHKGNFVFRHIFTEYISLRLTFIYITGYVSLTGIQIIPTIQNFVEISRVISDLNYAYGKTNQLSIYHRRTMHTNTAVRPTSQQFRTTHNVRENYDWEQPVCSSLPQ
jgi:hypothetical protein